MENDKCVENDTLIIVVVFLIFVVVLAIVMGARYVYLDGEKKYDQWYSYCEPIMKQVTEDKLPAYCVKPNY